MERGSMRPLGMFVAVTALTAALPGQPLITSTLRLVSNSAIPANELWGTRLGVL